MSEVPIRMSWLPGETIVPPRTVPCPPGGGRCELALGPVQPPGAAGLRVTASARGCEVLTGAPGAAPAYECTLRGVPLEGNGGIYTLEYAPQARLHPGTTVTLRLISLAVKASINVHSVELLESTAAPSGSTDPDGASPAASQMDGIREMLGQLAMEGPGGEGGAPADPRRALAAAIARSALAKGSSGSAAALSNASLSASQAPGGAEAILTQLLDLTQRQAADISRLTETVSRLEAVCLETRTTVKDLQAQLGGGPGSILPPTS